MTITSRQNERIKQAIKLRERRHRDARGECLIDGVREVGRAFDAGVKIHEAFVCEDLCQSDESKSLLARLNNGPTLMTSVSPAVFEKIGFGQREAGLVVIAGSPQRGLEDLQLPDKPLVAVVEGVEKPGNLGAILRSADAAGMDAVVVADGRTDLFNPNTIRSSLGTLFRANVCAASTEETIAWLRARGLLAFTASPEATRSYTDIDFRCGGAIVLGSEAEGLCQAWREVEGTAIRLPMRGMADSLNVSTAAAVLFYEALRQRGTS